SSASLMQLKPKSASLPATFWKLNTSFCLAFSSEYWIFFNFIVLVPNAEAQPPPECAKRTEGTLPAPAGKTVGCSASLERYILVIIVLSLFILIFVLLKNVNYSARNSRHLIKCQYLDPVHMRV